MRLSGCSALDALTTVEDLRHKGVRISHEGVAGVLKAAAAQRGDRQGVSLPVRRGD
jgi:hypothetical protein